MGDSVTSLVRPDRRKTSENRFINRLHVLSTLDLLFGLFVPITTTMGVVEIYMGRFEERQAVSAPILCNKHAS